MQTQQAEPAPSPHLAQVGNYGVAQRMLDALLKACPPALQPAFQSQLATCVAHTAADDAAADVARTATPLVGHPPHRPLSI